MCRCIHAYHAYLYQYVDIFLCFFLFILLAFSLGAGRPLVPGSNIIRTFRSTAISILWWNLQLVARWQTKLNKLTRPLAAFVTCWSKSAWHNNAETQTKVAMMACASRACMAATVLSILTGKRSWLKSTWYGGGWMTYPVPLLLLLLFLYTSIAASCAWAGLVEVPWHTRTRGGFSTET